jgi:hypothetical protein
MIKIGNEKLFTMTEILEAAKEYLKGESIEDIRDGKCDFEISAVAATIGESPEFVRGFVTSAMGNK